MDLVSPRLSLSSVCAAWGRDEVAPLVSEKEHGKAFRDARLKYVYVLCPELCRSQRRRSAQCLATRRLGFCY